MRIDSILVVDNASVFFPKRVGRKVLNVRAVDQVSFSISSAETFGLVGESGSGKSTAGNAAIGLQTLTAGNVFYRGLPIPARRDPKWREMRRQLQIVFQDPYSSLNPRRIIAQALTEPLALHKLVKPSEYTDEVERLLKLVGLPPEVAKCHPNELSGGQRQRVGIARALAVKPEIIVCDEITSALDVSTQAQIISLLSNLKKIPTLRFYSSPMILDWYAPSLIKLGLCISARLSRPGQLARFSQSHIIPTPVL